MAADDDENLQPPICAEEVRSISKGNGSSSFADPASAAESALMVSDAFRLRKQYSDLKMPVVIIAGEQDRMIDIDTQSARLHSDVPQSRFHRVARNGHMIQQTATDQVMSAIREVAAVRTEIASTAAE